MTKLQWDSLKVVILSKELCTVLILIAVVDSFLFASSTALARSDSTLTIAFSIAWLGIYYLPD
jgi:hypothetical protein